MSEENDVSARELNDSLESLSETVGNVVREREETERILAEQSEKLLELERHQAEDQAAIRALVGVADVPTANLVLKTHAAAIQRAREQAGT